MYRKTNWVDGQEPALSAENLNHIESGIEEASFNADMSYSLARSAELTADNAARNAAAASIKADKAIETLNQNSIAVDVSGHSPLTVKTLASEAYLAISGMCEQDTEDVLKDYVITNFFIYADEKEFTYVGDGARERTVYVKCKPNTHYVLTKSISSVSRMATTENVPVLNGKFTNFVTSITTTKLEITSGANDNYLTIQFFTDSATDFEISHYIEGAKVMPVPTPSEPIQIEYAHEHGSTNLLDGNDIKNWQTYQTSKVLRKVFQLKPNTSYTISQTKNYEESNANIFAVSGNDIGFSPTTPSNGCTVGNPRTIVSDSNGYITVGSRVEGKDYVMLNEGTSALPYEPFYKAAKLESFGNNGIDLSKATYGKAMNDSGAIITPSDLNCFVSDYISVESNTDYTLSFVRKDTVTYTRIMGYDANNSLIGMILKKTNVSVGKEVDTFKTQSNCAYVRLSITSIAEEYRIEKGTYATPYQHTELPLPFDLLGLAGAQDIWVAGDVTRRVIRYTGDDLARLPWQKGTLSFYVQNYFAPAQSTAEKSNALCNVVPTVPRDNLADFDYAIAVDNYGSLSFRVPNLSSLMVSEFTDLLKSWNTEIVVERNAPVIELAGSPILPTYPEQTTFRVDYCDIATTVRQNALDVIDERTKKVYSSEPRVIGKWFDGRDVLEVDFYTTSASNIDVSNLGIDVAIDISGNIKRGTCVNIPYNVSATDYIIPYFEISESRIKYLYSSGSFSTLVGLYLKITYVPLASASGRSAEPAPASEPVALSVEETETI